VEDEKKEAKIRLQKIKIKANKNPALGPDFLGRIS